MHVQYVGPFDAVTLSINGVARDVARRAVIDVPDELGARLLDQAVWADDDYDLVDAALADIVEWVGDDHGLAQIALAEEAQRATPRDEVVDHCHEVLGMAATAEDLGVDVEAVTAAIAQAAAVLDVPEAVHSLKPRSIRKAKEQAAASDAPVAPPPTDAPVAPAAPAATAPAQQAVDAGRPAATPVADSAGIAPPVTPSASPTPEKES